MKLYLVTPWLAACGYLSSREDEPTVDPDADADSDGDGSDSDVDSATESDSSSETGSSTGADECFGVAFAIEIVDADGDGASYSAVFVEREATHVFYQFKSDGAEVYEVRHATDASGAWERETVDAEPGVGFGLSAAADASGDFHLAYANFLVEPYDLHYTTNVSGRWSAERVEDRPIVGDPILSIDVDGEGAPHLAHPRRDLVTGSESIELTVSSSGDWSTETVWSWRAGGGFALAIDDSNSVKHVTASSGERLGVDYFTNATGAWASEAVDSGFLTSQTYPKMRLDSDGAVHAVYVRPGQAVEHAARSEDGWTTQTIDEGEYLDVAFTIGSRDSLHVAYTDEDEHAVRYATNASGDWVVETVDDQPRRADFRWVSIALDGSDVPTISYEQIDADRGSLMVARRCPP